mgnify:CR=1 FL=1
MSFDPVEPIHQVPIDGTLDLHQFSPKDIGELIPEFIEECHRRGIFRLRIVHGKGIGASYYWHPSYMPEIRLVYPPDEEIGEDVWFGKRVIEQSVWEQRIGEARTVIAVAASVVATEHRPDGLRPHPGAEDGRPAALGWVLA